MVRRTAIRATLVAATLLASAACSGDGADKGSAGANPTLATDPPTTTTTNPYAVPAVIDVAYVNRVLSGLDQVMGDASRDLVRSRTITADVYDRLRAIYGSNGLLQLVVETVEEEIRKNFSGFKPNPGNRSTLATRIVTAQPDCVFARVDRDYSAMSPSAGTPQPQWIALRPLELVRDPRGYNPTRWAMIYDGFTPDRSQPENPCLR